MHTPAAPAMHSAPRRIRPTELRLDPRGCADVLEHLGRATPSVRRVVQALCRHGAMTTAELTKRVGLPRRTVFAALQHLAACGVLDMQRDLRDTRRRLHWISPPARPRPPEAGEPIRA